MMTLANPFIPTHIHPSIPLSELSPSSPADCPVCDKDQSNRGEDLLACLIDYNAVSMHCYTILPRGCYKSSTNIAKITFRRPDLPHDAYISRVPPCLNISVRPPLPSMSELLASLRNTADQTALHNHANVPVVVTSIIYFIEAALPINLSLRQHFLNINLASLREWKDQHVFLLLLPIPVLSLRLPLITLVNRCLSPFMLPLYPHPSFMLSMVYHPELLYNF